MVISAYQVNNVLRVYGDQLRHGRISHRGKDTSSRAPDKISISPEARRKAIIDKIAAHIVERITSDGAQEDMEEKVSKNIEDKYGVNLDITKKSPADVIFKVIDENGETLNSISIEDAGFSKYRLEEVRKAP